MDNVSPLDPHEQIHSLYMSLLTEQERFDEFRQLLAMYPRLGEITDGEPKDAAKVRRRLNSRIRKWTGKPFDGLSSMQMQLWRSILVDQRINVGLSPWKESNWY